MVETAWTLAGTAALLAVQNLGWVDEQQASRH
jgi:hypothetical protein